MSDLPLVSILIPCYNAGDWVGACIESALAQSYPAVEVIALDDGSGDLTWENLQAFGDRIQAKRQENAGGNVTRNRLLEMASGQWIQYLDADDWLGEDKISRQLAAIGELDFEPDFLYGEVNWATMEGDRVGHVETPPITRSDLWEQLVTWELPQTGAPLFRKEALTSVGGWKADQPCCQEHELYMRLLMAEKRFHYTGVTEAYYRQWSEATVCRRNVPLVHEKRMEIVLKVRDFLISHEMLTGSRRDAICQAAFETARSAYAYSPKRSDELYAFINKESPGFRPVGPAAAPGFLRIASLFGYSRAERIAGLKRRLLGR